jgi:hypothetical protein
MCVLKLLENPTLAAAVGGIVAAIATYRVVAFTDRRRAAQKAHTRVPAQLRLYRTLVKNRIEAVNGALASVTRPGVPTESIGDRFPVERIRSSAEDLADHLKQNQVMALYNIAFMMEQADAMNSAALAHIATRRRGPLDTARTVSDEEAKGLLLQTYTRENTALKRADELIEAYLSNRLSDTGGPTNMGLLDPH